MESKYSISSQEEIHSILNYLERWNKFFSIETHYFIDGWSISLSELTLYPRHIIIVKNFNQNYYEIKSFEVSISESFEEEYNELFSVDKINNKEDLIKEIREIIYGKDLFKDIKKSLKKIRF